MALAAVVTAPGAIERVSGALWAPRATAGITLAATCASADAVVNAICVHHP